VTLEVVSATLLEVVSATLLEVAPNLPDRAGVRVLLENLRESGIPASVGKVCGSRVSAVYLGAALEVVSVTLEPFELDDAELARAKTATFVREVQQLETSQLETLQIETSQLENSQIESPSG
jgi:hypothetical protein